MINELKDVQDLSRWWRHLVNAYEVKTQAWSKVMFVCPSVVVWAWIFSLFWVVGSYRTDTIRTEDPSLRLICSDVSVWTFSYFSTDSYKRDDDSVEVLSFDMEKKCWTLFRITWVYLQKNYCNSAFGCCCCWITDTRQLRSGVRRCDETCYYIEV